MRYSSKESECVACGASWSDLHHIKTRGAGGDDQEWNLMPLCRACHTQVHQIGLGHFSQRNYQVRLWLIKHGWELCPGFGHLKWIHPKK